MSALTNHAIGFARCNGYGRCEALLVWISAAHDEQRVVSFLYRHMDEENTTSSAGPRRAWRLLPPDAYGECDCEECNVADAGNNAENEIGENKDE